ncbi:MAG: FAD-dependent monooxygenase [Mycolicibacterium rufum]|uniref:3-hydroxybenzoate 6-hydroxylase 1 n=1 Tax=Mycolicibacterium chlorophenolicum TaxID=37916 RepID=A0A0J6VLE0_9MYCO|nr:FAD-dependent monooxygenase [Mycolicibacterium chlorophenolicum]KMO70367.1 3-hydroxybenzoate 6-hydroxylase 1 [Mycolicibacterium chlorophenolicum]MBI5336076.1 FAD-dependent monooxygenase [Mycolicibacterium rufum]
MPFHAVISGAGIAGPALAHQLTARGWRTTVLERYPQRRDEGQNVDIRGAAREVIRRMGIDGDVRAANTGEIGTRFVTADGTPAASFPVARSGRPDGPTAELEILRGELSRILVERTADRTDYRFGTQLADVTDHGDHVTAELDDGTALDADLLVIAEGLHSRSRRFVSSAEVQSLGMYIAYVTLPHRDTDDRWWNWQHVTKSRGVHLRPDNVGTTRAILSFLSDVRGLEDLGQQDQIALLRGTFADVGGAAPRILDELDSGAPMYFSAVGQVHPASWSKGRVGLLGDSAFCNATFGGAGTSLALIGAYLLAGELAAGPDPVVALTRYQKAMQPFVKTAPTVRAEVLRLANPRSRNGIRVVHTGARLAAGPLGRAVSALTGMAGIGGDELALPEYR